MNQVNSRICNQCGSVLIKQETIVEVNPNSNYPVTRTTYICTNESCQEAIDKRTAEIVKRHKEQAEAKLLKQARFQKKA